MPRAAGSLNFSTIRQRDAILAVLARTGRTMTVRQVFYALVSDGAIDKTENWYTTIQRQIAIMRKYGHLDWDLIVDGSRRARGVTTWSDLDSYIDNVARAYRRELWKTQNARVVIWLEKDALADIVAEVTDRWLVPLMVTRGFSSLTFLHNALMDAQAHSVPVHMYTLYDWDKSGDDAHDAIIKFMEDFATDVDMTISRLALTEEQVAEWGILTRPAKRARDGVAAELDAIPIEQLLSIVEGAITQHIDMKKWNAQKRAQKRDIAKLRAIVR